MENYQQEDGSIVVPAAEEYVEKREGSKNMEGKKMEMLSQKIPLYLKTFISYFGEKGLIDLSCL